MEKKHTRGSFTGSIGFVLAAAGSAVGLGNIWRFPYLAAKDGGGTFILVYIVLALTFGFTLLTTDIAIGRKTGQSPLVAYGKIHPGWNGLGLLASIVPVVILPYYCSIGGWVLKYLSVFLTGHGTAAAEDGYFTGYITGTWQPIVWLGIYLFLTAFVVYRGVNKGIENYSKILMPILLILIIGISVFSLTLTHTDADGVVRTGLQGMKIYLVPNFKGMTLQKFFTVFVDALGQLFFSISVAMGIMVAYGSYVKKETNLMKSINQIEIFDTGVAFLAGLMIIPAVYVFLGTDGMASNNNHDLFQDMYLMGTIYKGHELDPAIISPKQVIAAATRGGALAQGREDCGLVKVGMKADLTVLDTTGASWCPMTNPEVNVVFSGHGSDVVLTMCDGEVVYRDGECPGVDLEQVKAEVAARTKRIISEL